MSADTSQLPLARRWFLSRLGVGAAAFGAAFGGKPTGADAQAVPPGDGGHWQPARHAQDDWFEQLPGKHRFFFDTTTAQGLGHAMLFANNYFVANKNAYGLENGDLAVVICVRHQSTPFAFNDAMWAKYGAGLAQRARFEDPKTSQAPTVNVYTASGYGEALPNYGITLEAVSMRGVHLAVCQMATRASAATIAQKTGGKAEDIYNELVANLVGNAHVVPAGIVAVNRAQERGYSLTYAG
jgi:intracellular sulfur oxidation DsrE/DsrF family protein